MPSRRGVLAGAATAAVSLPLAGCSPLDPPELFARWLHAPDAVLTVDDWGFASLDAGAVRRHRDTLPASWAETLSDLERAFDAVDLADLDRVTVQAGAAPGARAAGSAVLAGGFDAEAAAADLRERYDGLQREGSVAGRQLYTYEPAVLADLQELADGDAEEPVDGTAGLAVGEGRLVLGVAVAPRSREGLTGVEAARASIRAGAGERRRLAAADDDAGLALDAFGAADAVVGARLPYDDYVAALDADAPERRLLAGVRLTAVGAELDGSTSVLLAYGDDRRVGLDDVRAALRALEAESTLEVTNIEPRQGGRAYVLSIESAVSDLWRTLLETTES